MTLPGKVFLIIGTQLLTNEIEIKRKLDCV